MGKDGREWLAQAERTRLLELRTRLFIQAIEMAVEQYQSAGIAIQADYEKRMAGDD